jgi:bifunctional non-homologous end joining protein LigD
MAPVRWPPLVRPMLAVAGDLARGDGWSYEFKWDGVRCVAYLAGGRVRLMSRNDRDITLTYPELAALGGLAGGSSAVLDGELVTVDDRGAPSFSALQRRMHVAAPSAALLAAVPVRYVAFDVLRWGRPLVDRPWWQRRERLEGLGPGEGVLDVPPAFPGDPDTVLAAARDLGLDGVVAKRVEAPYQPGRRSPAWRKTALIRTTEVLVAGWKPGEGRRAGTVGSLVLGAYDERGELRFVGGVGTGFTAGMLADLTRRLAPLERPDPPFAERLPAADARGARWVRPEIVGEVVYRTLTPDRRLRHAAWRGLRADRDPGEVRLP